MKRILTVLAATLLLTAAMAGTASASSYDSVAEELSAIGVFRGTAGGFELDRAPTRSEAAIMLVRLYGAEDEARGGRDLHALHRRERNRGPLRRLAVQPRHHQRHLRHHFRRIQSVQRKNVLRLPAAGTRL